MVLSFYYIPRSQPPPSPSPPLLLSGVTHSDIIQTALIWFLEQGNIKLILKNIIECENFFKMLE